MNKHVYGRLLKSPHWQKMRLKIFERDEWKCTKCSDSESELQAHHTEYRKNKKPWEYPMKCITTLCWRCHERAHGRPGLTEQELVEKKERDDIEEWNRLSEPEKKAEREFFSRTLRELSVKYGGKVD